MNRLKSQLQLTASLAEVKRDAIRSEEETSKKARDDLQAIAPRAAKKYMDKKNVTKKDLCAILFAAFGVHIKETGHKKAELDKMLKEQVEKTSNVPIKNLIVETNVETNDNATTGNESGNALPIANV